MVPQKISEIAHALDQAIVRLQEQIARDRRSLRYDENTQRARQGAAALDAVLKAADAVRSPLAEQSRTAIKSAERRTGAPHD